MHDTATDCTLLSARLQSVALRSEHSSAFLCMLGVILLCEGSSFEYGNVPNHLTQHCTRCVCAAAAVHFAVPFLDDLQKNTANSRRKEVI